MTIGSLRAGLVVAALLGLTAVGCRPTPPVSLEPAGTGGTAPSENPGGSARETVTDWYETIAIDGHLVGHSHVRHRRPPDAATAPPGHLGDVYEGETTMSLTRFGQAATMRLTQVSEEDDTGRVLAFRTTLDQGDGEQTTHGRRVGDRFELTVAGPPGGGVPTRTETLAVPPDVGGFYAVERSLADDPLPPGRTRSLDVLVPMLNVVGRVTLSRPTDGAAPATAGPVAPGAPPTHPVNAVLNVAGTELATTYHVADDGTVWRTDVPSVRQSTARVDVAEFRRAEATLGRGGPSGATPTGAVAAGPTSPNPSGGAYDLGVETLVPIAGDLAGLAARPAVTYRVTLTGGTASPPTTDAQTVRPAGKPGEFDVTVRASRPPAEGGGSPANGRLPGGPMTAEVAAALAPGPMIQSDDPRMAAIVAGRRAALGAGASPGRLAADLTAHVHGRLTEKNFSRAFASAAEVLARPEGDCTEHAVLLAALLRAAGVPARVAVGLVVLPERSALAFHMWTEAYVGGVWVGFDATRPGEGVGPDRITVLTSDLSAGGGFAALLPVVNLLGRMTVEVRPAAVQGPVRPPAP